MPAAVVTDRAWRGGGDLVHLRWMYRRGQGAFFAEHLAASDGYRAHRLRNTLRDHSGRIRHQLRRQPRGAAGEVAHIVGLIGAVAEWLLTQRGAS
ncbi:MAG TPA: hypothetical protein VIV06_05030 [Candidatus Limnocylindrales bacterium]